MSALGLRASIRSRRHGRLCWSRGVIAVAMVTAAACRGSASGAPLPEASPIVDVTMRDNRFDFNPAIPSGQVVFRVHNDGKVAHELEMIPLQADIPPIDVQLHSSQRRNVVPTVELSARPPGGTGIFAAKLEAGVRYAFVCFLLGPDGRPYALEGMNAEFTAADQPVTR